MPIGNNFQHSVYSRSDPGERVSYREFVPGAPPDSLAWQDAMARFGGDMDKAGVRAVLFVHGTFLGSDLFGAQRLDEAGGLKRGYSRGIPGVDALLAQMREGTNGLSGFPGVARPPFPDSEAITALIDKHAGDLANFSAGYVNTIGAAINRSLSRPISCHRLFWSCEHHHLGRALAACLILDAMEQLHLRLRLVAGDRILVQAHGQAGLLLALLSNLLGPIEASSLKTFFEILEDHQRQVNAPSTTDDTLSRVHARLREGLCLNGVTVDLVTYGLPVRYGWDPCRLGKVLHVVNHRPMRADGKRWLAKMEFPQITMEMPLVWGGDYVQQLAIAGTDAVPSTEEGKNANKALWELLEPYDGFERWLECARKAVRCQADGHCLLVDYKDAALMTALPAKDHVYGHAAYTRMNAVLFNTTEIVHRFYSS